MLIISTCAIVLASCFGIFGHSLAFVAGIFLFAPLYVVLSSLSSVLTGVVYVNSFYPLLPNWRTSAFGGLLAGAIGNVFWFLQPIQIVWSMYLLGMVLSLLGSLVAHLYFRKSILTPKR